MAKRKTQLYNLRWSRLSLDEFEQASDMDRVRSWNMVKGMNATEVAQKLETTIIPNRSPFELEIWDIYGEGRPIIEANPWTISINRGVSISQTILRALS